MLMRSLLRFTLLLKVAFFPFTDASWFGSSSKKEEEPPEDLSALVSPIINRELETAVVAHSWPSNPQNVLCEAYAYFQSTYSNDGPRQELSDEEKELSVALNQQFLTRLSDAVGSTSTVVPLETYAAASEVVETAAAPILSNTRLLKYALSLRAYSPQCELHRGLARQKLKQMKKLASFRDRDAFAVVYPGGSLVLEEDIANTDWTTFSHGVVTDADDDLDDLLLPGEFPFGSANQVSADGGVPQLIILYANLGTPAFSKAYNKLLADVANVMMNVRFVVRHLGAVHYEELGKYGLTQPTILQGYGVRLDIRNVEYKVFDDRGGSGGDAGTGMVNLTADNDNILGKPPSQFLAGVNYTALGMDDKDILSSLWKQHEAQQANLIPPNWQRRKLPLQATSVISNSKDPLMTLEEVSLNLPSVASTLVHHKVSEEIEELAHKLDEDLSRLLPKSGALLINGRQVNQLDRPTFNMFELLNLLRKEQVALSKLQKELGPYVPNKVLKRVKEAWAMGDDFLDVVQDASEGEATIGEESKHYRIDVGRGWKQCIMYLNDIEKDPKYAQWPKSVRQVFMAMQFGMPPSIRRNLFTILSVMDPLVVSGEGDDLSSFQNVGMLLGKQLMQSNYPARLGVLLVGDKDVQECAAWVAANPDSPEGEACPAFGKEPIISDPDVQESKLKELPASTRSLHRLVSPLVANYPGDMVDAYVEYVLQALEEQKSMMGGNSLFDLLEIHSSTLASMRLGGSKGKHLKDALKLLTTAEDDDDDTDSPTKPKYGKALRFAVDKGLQGGMSFVNGRPLPSGVPEEVFDKAGSIFNEEMQHIFGLIQKGEIKDSTPKSVYALFLSGKGVYKKVHPLLLDSRDKGDSYIKIPHEFNSKSLIFPSGSADDVKAVFILDAVFDLGTKRGLQLARSLVSVMDSFPHSIPDTSGGNTIGIKIGYRILPSTSSSTAQAWCPILAMAGEIGSDSLSQILDGAFQATSQDLNLAELAGFAEKLSSDVVEIMRENLSGGPCSRMNAQTQATADNLIASNGLFYALEGSSITKDDVELLISMDLDFAKAVTHYFGESLPVSDPEGCDAMARIASFLAIEAAVSQFERVGMERIVDALEAKFQVDKNPLRFSWNEEDDSSDLQLKITAFVDPTSEMCQRMSPLLRVFRDTLRLPLTLILTPRPILDADAKAPVTSFYRFVAEPLAQQDSSPPKAIFTNLPIEHTLTLRLDVPESWDVQQSNVIQDTDNLRCDIQIGCSDEAYSGEKIDDSVPIHQRDHLTRVEYGLNSLLIFGQCYETKGSSPNGLQLTLTRKQDLRLELPQEESQPEQEIEVGMDGTIKKMGTDTLLEEVEDNPIFSDTLVMKTVGYWQLRANPGVWNVQIAKESKGAEIFNVVDGMVRRGQIKLLGQKADNSTKKVVLKDFVNRGELLLVQRRKGFEKAKLFSDVVEKSDSDEEEVINVFSLATGHLYERFLKIMMLSVTRRTSSKVKFWLFENFLSPSFKSSARYMADRIGCEVEFVTYKWPEWLRGQSEKQRIIWGYKILFLDVLFPLNVKKIIYVDADQVVRGDLKELWDMDLEGAPYGYTPMCSSRESTLGYQFWRGGFWESHLQGRPYHISALYVVDLEKFRRQLVGDQLRSIYQQLSADPNSLANLDQDLPNYAQHAVPIFSLPQEWLWCESWCSDETKKDAKTIDLCNNPLHKEPKVSMAKRIISGPLFQESWVELDEIVEGYQKEWLETTEAS